MDVAKSLQFLHTAPTVLNDSSQLLNKTNASHDSCDESLTTHCPPLMQEFEGRHARLEHAVVVLIREAASSRNPLSLLGAEREAQNAPLVAGEGSQVQDSSEKHQGRETNRGTRIKVVSFFNQSTVWLNTPCRPQDQRRGRGPCCPGEIRTTPSNRQHAIVDLERRGSEGKARGTVEDRCATARGETAVEGPSLPSAAAAAAAY